MEEGQSWQLAITTPRRSTSSAKPSHSKELDSVVNHLVEAFQWLGAGAKTNIGMGRFAIDSAAEERVAREEEERKRKREEVEKQLQEQAEFEASIADASPQLQTLMSLKREQNWQPSAGDNKMMEALNKFANQNPQPPEDCVNWIRDWLESIPKYHGVWNDPDAMGGKRKDKPKYKAKGVRELVKKLNPKFRQ